MSVYNKDTNSYTISGKNNYAWSANNNVFYLISDLLTYISNNNWPDDAIEVSDDVFSEYSSFQNGNGKVRGVGEDGMPVWVDAPEPAPEDKIAVAEMQKQRLLEQANSKIAPLQDAVELALATKEEEDSLLAWKKYRIQLSRVNSSLAPDIEWPPLPDNVQ